MGTVDRLEEEIVGAISRHVAVGIADRPFQAVGRPGHDTEFFHLFVGQGDRDGLFRYGVDADGIGVDVTRVYPEGFVLAESLVPPLGRLLALFEPDILVIDCPAIAEIEGLGAAAAVVGARDRDRDTGKRHHEIFHGKAELTHLAVTVDEDRGPSAHHVIVAVGSLQQNVIDAVDQQTGVEVGDDLVVEASVAPVEVDILGVALIGALVGQPDFNQVVVLGGADDVGERGDRSRRGRGDELHHGRCRIVRIPDHDIGGALHGFVAVTDGDRDGDPPDPVGGDGRRQQDVEIGRRAIHC
ncbi:MAG: hypothetical protein AB2742_08700 [Candidatus Thiodiazotropha endolucinida]